jgi:MFS transporter, MHS family, metabolite:H+ symporter
VLLRVLQCFGAGAEQAGATTLMAEYAPQRRRGYFAALPFVGIMAGTVLASIVFYFLAQVDPQVVHDWLWRVPFLASVILIGVALFIRLRLRESPTFIKLEQQHAVAKNPFADVFRGSWRTIIRGIGLRMAENGGSAIYQTLAVGFITNVVGLQHGEGPLAITIGAVIGLALIPFTGHLSDRFGRIAIYRAGVIAQLLLAVPAWWALSTGIPVVDVIVLALTYTISVNVMLGAQCALLPELFGNRHRYIGVAVSREFSAVLAGGIAPFIGALLLGTFMNSWVPLAAYVLLLGAITLWATFTTPETRGRDLNLINDAIDDTDVDVQTRPSPVVSQRERRLVGTRS